MRKSTFISLGNRSSQGPEQQEAPGRKRKMTVLSRHDSEEEQIKALERAFPNFFVGKTMKEGESFGDIALQHRTRRYSSFSLRKINPTCFL